MARRFTRFLRRNTIALLALFLALSGTTFAAANALGPNTVGAKQLKKNAVTSKKIKNNAVTGAKVKNDSLTGADIVESSLGTVPSATNAATANTAQHLPALTWSPLTLQNGWAPYGSPTNTYYDPPTYTKDAEGFVHLKGALSGSSQTSTNFATLPAGFRPSVKDMWLPVTSTNAASDPHLVNLNVSNAGVMTVYNTAGANDAFVSLDGVEFYAG